MLKERGKEKTRIALHPKCGNKRRKVNSFLFLHFFFLYGFFPLCLFFFSSASEEEAIVFFFHFLFLFEAKKVMTQVCRCLFFSSIFVVNKANDNKLDVILKVSPPTYLPHSYLPPTYLLHFILHSLHYQESLKWEGRRGRAELGARSGRAKMQLGESI